MPTGESRYGPAKACTATASSLSALWVAAGTESMTYPSLSWLAPRHAPARAKRPDDLISVQPLAYQANAYNTIREKVCGWMVTVGLAAPHNPPNPPSTLPCDCLHRQHQRLCSPVRSHTLTVKLEQAPLSAGTRIARTHARDTCNERAIDTHPQAGRTNREWHLLRFLVRYARPPLALALSSLALALC